MEKILKQIGQNKQKSKELKKCWAGLTTRWASWADTRVNVVSNLALTNDKSFQLSVITKSPRENAYIRRVDTAKRQFFNAVLHWRFFFSVKRTEASSGIILLHLHYSLPIRIRTDKCHSFRLSVLSNP